MTRTTAGSSTATRSTVAASAALVGAGLIAASTIGHGAPTTAPTPPSLQNLEVRLAANSVTNIPTNIYQTIANIPAVQYGALQKTTKAFDDSGNWWLYIPTNVVGFDQQDYDKVKAISLLLMPIPLVADAQSDQLWITLATFAPMTPNCTGVPGPCSDPLYFLQYGQVPTWQLINGYTFPEITNTIDPDHQYYETADGTQVPIQPWWSGQTVTLDPLGPAKAIWQTLTQDPTGVQQGPTAEQWATAYSEFARSAFNGLNPFVDGTYCLPCQLVGAKGAPGSLPKFALFGNYYTIFDLGQQLTDKDWVVNRPDYDETTREDHVTVTNFWSPQAWKQIYTDGVGSVEDSVAMIPQLPTLIPQNLAAFGDQLDAFSKLLAHNIIANGNGLGTAGVTTWKSADELAAAIKQSFTNALPGLADGNRTTASTTTPTPTSVTLSAARALGGDAAEPVAAPSIAGPSSTTPSSTTPSMTTPSSPAPSGTGTTATSSSAAEAAPTTDGGYVGKHRADSGADSTTGNTHTDSTTTGGTTTDGAPSGTENPGSTGGSGPTGDASSGTASSDTGSSDSAAGGTTSSGGTSSGGSTGGSSTSSAAA